MSTLARPRARPDQHGSTPTMADDATTPQTGQPDNTTTATSALAPAAGGEPTDNPPAPPAPGPDATTQAALEEATRKAEEATARADQMQAALDAIGAALNPDGDAAQEKDPAQLAAAVTERDAQIADLSGQLRASRVELAAYKAAGDAGARPDRLLNSRAFVAELAALDPDADGFGDQLAAAITAAVEADPELYRAGPGGPPRGGAEFNGPPAADRRPANLRDAIAARLGG